MRGTLVFEVPALQITSREAKTKRRELTRQLVLRDGLEPSKLVRAFPKLYGVPIYEQLRAFFCGRFVLGLNIHPK